MDQQTWCRCLTEQVDFSLWCDGQMTLSHHTCVCKTTRLPRLNAAARTGQSFAMFRQPKTQVEIMLAFNSAAVACKKSLDWQALKGCERILCGRAIFLEKSNTSGLFKTCWHKRRAKTECRKMLHIRAWIKLNHLLNRLLRQVVHK